MITQPSLHLLAEYCKSILWTEIEEVTNSENYVDVIYERSLLTPLSPCQLYLSSLSLSGKACCISEFIMGGNRKRVKGGENRKRAAGHRFYFIMLA